MKILITDDQTLRYSRLAEELAEIGVDRREIDIVSCANTAREKLERVSYDLLILDILLPLWPENIPEIRHSLDLLMELHESEEFHKPRHILGITSEKSVAGKASASFEEKTWSIVEFSESNDEWINRVINCVEYIQKEKNRSAAESSTYGVDLAIICALEKPELEEVLKLPWNWTSSRPLDDIIFVHDGYFYVGERKITVCATFAPRMGMVSAALRSAAVISLLRPRLMVMCGICAGVRGKANFGDVILADPAWDFQSGKRECEKGNPRFAISPHHLCPTTLVRTHVEQIRGDRNALREIVDEFADAPSDKLRIIIGPLASGSAVLADGEIVGEIKDQHRDLVGVEMEIYGMYAAAHSASKPQPQSFALKAVCDFADPEKEDKHQRYAAYTSANVLRLLMERFGSRLLD